MGLCTPPVGSVLFIGCSVAGTKDRSGDPSVAADVCGDGYLVLGGLLARVKLLIPRLFGL